MRVGIFITIALLLCSCRPLSREEHVKRDYECHHAELVAYWRKPETRILSFLRGYDGVPGYRAIVALGHPAVPYIAQSVREKGPGSEALAWAIVDIERWKGFGEPPEEIRDRVLARLDETR